MIFEPTLLHGVYCIHAEPRGDERGFFARMFCADEFAAMGLETRFVQANISRSVHRGTLRGMHYQLGADAEVKLVRCTAGRLFDVALDLRPDSPSFGKWFGVELSAEDPKMLYVPRGCAHGFVSREDDTEISYMVSAAYSSENERGIRFDDPRFAISWPEPVRSISNKDANHPDFDPVAHGIDRLAGLLRGAR